MRKKSRFEFPAHEARLDQDLVLHSTRILQPFAPAFITFICWCHCASCCNRRGNARRWPAEWHRAGSAPSVQWPQVRTQAALPHSVAIAQPGSISPGAVGLRVQAVRPAACRTGTCTLDRRQCDSRALLRRCVPAATPITADEAPAAAGPRQDGIRVALKLTHTPAAGHTMGVCGSIPELGAWQQENLLRMNDNGGSVWTAEFFAEPRYVQARLITL